MFKLCNALLIRFYLEHIAENLLRNINGTCSFQVLCLCVSAGISEQKFRLYNSTLTSSKGTEVIRYDTSDFAFY